jgi:hypothetical protein
VFFFLIYGFKVRYKTLMTGTFFCPKCGGDRQYERRQARRWFHLYYIPLIPAKILGEQIKCTTCGTNFRDSVLSRPTSGQLSAVLVDAVRGLAVHVLRAGSTDSPAARAAAVNEARRAGLAAYSDADLSADLDVVPGDLSQLLAGLGPQLAEPGKEGLVAGAAKIALADGPFSDLERQVVVSAGAALGMTAAHTVGVIALAEQSAPRA